GLAFLRSIRARNDILPCSRLLLVAFRCLYLPQIVGGGEESHAQRPPTHRPTPRFRPLRFASYNAASASATSTNDAPPRSGVIVETPALIVTGVAAATRSRSISATRRACSASVSGSSTANSSPP